MRILSGQEKRNIFFPETKLAPHKEILIFRKEAFGTGILPLSEEKNNRKQKKGGKKESISKKRLLSFCEREGKCIFREVS